MRIYPDTSFLVSLYLQDDNTDRAVLATTRNPPPFLITALHRAEFANAVSLRVFRWEISRRAARLAKAQFRQDASVGRFELLSLPSSLYAEAESLSSRRTPRLGARTLDVLHVASARLLDAEAFLTFDKRQARLARAEGLKTP